MPLSCGGNQDGRYAIAKNRQNGDWLGHVEAASKREEQSAHTPLFIHFKDPHIQRRGNPCTQLHQFHSLTSTFSYLICG